MLHTCAAALVSTQRRRVSKAQLLTFLGGQPPRASLAERAGQYGGIKKTSAPPRSATTSAKPSGVSRSVGSRPKSSLGIVVGAGKPMPPPNRPASVQSLHDEEFAGSEEEAGTSQEELESHTEFKIALPKRKGLCAVGECAGDVLMGRRLGCQVATRGSRRYTKGSHPNDQQR